MEETKGYYLEWGILIAAAIGACWLIDRFTGLHAAVALTAYLMISTSFRFAERHHMLLTKIEDLEESLNISDEQIETLEQKVNDLEDLLHTMLIGDRDAKRYGPG